MDLPIGIGGDTPEDTLWIWREKGRRPKRDPHGESSRELGEARRKTRTGKAEQTSHEGD